MNLLLVMLTYSYQRRSQMSRRLEDHLYPAGTIADSTITPSVLDSEGNAVEYNSAKRKTTEVTVVDLGDSPNSNNGDPLRVAFGKVNNFIEASYWANETIATDLDRFEARLDSDEIEIQALKTELNHLLDSEYRNNADRFAIHEARLDSDEAKLESISTRFEHDTLAYDSDIRGIDSDLNYLGSNVALIIKDETGTVLKTIYGKTT